MTDPLFTTVSGVVLAHGQTRTLTETIFYPDHVTRGAESSEFQNTKQKLTKQGEGCYVCGLTQEELGPSVRMEGHHFNSEWSLVNSLDLVKVQKDFPDVTDVKTFLDSLENLILLCPKHHRSNLYGVHMITMPAWIVQKYQKDGWDLVTGSGVAAMPEDQTKWFPEH